MTSGVGSCLGSLSLTQRIRGIGSGRSSSLAWPMASPLASPPRDRVTEVWCTEAFYSFPPRRTTPEGVARGRREAHEPHIFPMFHCHLDPVGLVVMFHSSDETQQRTKRFDSRNSDGEVSYPCWTYIVAAGRTKPAGFERCQAQLLRLRLLCRGVVPASERWWWGAFEPRRNRMPPVLGSTDLGGIHGHCYNLGGFPMQAVCSAAVSQRYPSLSRQPDAAEALAFLHIWHDRACNYRLLACVLARSRHSSVLIAAHK